MTNFSRDFWGLPLVSPLFGLVAEGVDGGSFAAAAVAIGVCGAEVCGVFDEFGVCASWVVVVEFECVGCLGWCGVVDGLATEVAGCVVFCAPGFEFGGEFLLVSGVCPAHVLSPDDVRVDVGVCVYSACVLPVMKNPSWRCCLGAHTRVAGVIIHGCVTMSSHYWSGVGGSFQVGEYLAGPVEVAVAG